MSALHQPLDHRAIAHAVKALVLYKFRFLFFFLFF